MTKENNAPIDNVLRQYFHQEMPKPFPKAPLVFHKPFNRFSGVSARLALAASLLILFGMGLLWPRYSTNNTINFKSIPSSASDDKRHRLPLYDSKDGSKALTTPIAK